MFTTTYPMTFEAWLQIGREAGWVSGVVCATHEGVPGTPEENEAWEDGGDPCQSVVRVW